MPESLNQNSVIANDVIAKDVQAPDSDLHDSRPEAEATVAFLPPMVGRLLIVGWILLFAGRWLVVQGMYAAGLLAPELVDNLDDRVLSPCYLLLLSVTLVTLVIRIVRGRSTQPDPPNSKMEFSAQRTAAALEGAAEPEASDRGGKQA